MACTQKGYTEHFNTYAFSPFSVRSKLPAKLLKKPYIMAWNFGCNKSRELNFPSTLSLQDCSGLRPPIDREQADKFCCGKPLEFHGFSLLAVCVTTFSNMKDRKEWCEQDRKWKESNGFSFNNVEVELSAEAPKCSRSH